MQKFIHNYFYTCIIISRRVLYTVLLINPLTTARPLQWSAGHDSYVAVIAPMAEVESSHRHSSSYQRKKRKKGRYIKQGYHKSERDDTRRVVARSFLSGITRDGHFQSRGLAQAQEKAALFLNASLTRKLSTVAGGTLEKEPSPPSTPVLEARYLPSPTLKLAHDASLESPKRASFKLLTATKSLDYVTDSHPQYWASATRSTTYVYTEHSSEQLLRGEVGAAALHAQSRLSSVSDASLIHWNKIPLPGYQTARGSR